MSVLANMARHAALRLQYSALIGELLDARPEDRDEVMADIRATRERMAELEREAA